MRKLIYSRKYIIQNNNLKVPEKLNIAVGKGMGAITKSIVDQAVLDLSKFIPDVSNFELTTQVSTKSLQLSVLQPEEERSRIFQVTLKRIGKNNDWFLSPIELSQTKINLSVCAVVLRAIVSVISAIPGKGVIVTSQSNSALLHNLFSLHFYFLSEVDLYRRYQLQTLLDHEISKMTEEDSSPTPKLPFFEYAQEISGIQSVNRYPLVCFLHSQEIEEMILNHLPEGDKNHEKRIRRFFRSEFILTHFNFAKHLFDNLRAKLALEDLEPVERHNFVLQAQTLSGLLNAFCVLLPEEFRNVYLIDDDFDFTAFTRWVVSCKQTLTLIEGIIFDLENQLLDDQNWRSFKDKFNLIGLISNMPI